MKRTKTMSKLPLSPEEKAVYEGLHLAELHLVMPKLLEKALQEVKMSWRPKDWKPLWTEQQIKEAPESIRLQMQLCYEEGADAMLEALRKELPPHLYVSLCNQQEGHHLIKGDKIHGKRLKKGINGNNY